MDASKETAKPTEAVSAPAPAEPVAEDKGQAAKAAAVEALVGKWVAGLRDGPIANHTPAWNALVASLPDLQAAIINHGG